MIPNLFIIGAHKAATTTLYTLLQQHRDIFLSPVKEPAFFSWESRWQQSWSWYENFFFDYDDEIYMGEGSTTYSQTGVFPSTPERIYKAQPNAKLIYCVRHPVERIESAWVQYRSQGRRDVPSDFNHAVINAPQLIDASLYHKQLCAFLEFFDKRQILVIEFSDFVQDPWGHLEKVLDFLDLDVGRLDGFDESLHLNESSSKRQPTPISYWGRLVAGVLPRGLRYYARTLTRSGKLDSALFTSIPAPIWSNPTLNYVLPIVLEDAKRFLESQGWPPDTWDFSPYIRRL